MITVDLTCMNLPQPSRILDIGCGTGRHLAMTLSLNQAMIIGADPDRADLKQALNRLRFHQQVGARGCGTRCHLTAASLDYLPFNDQCFDLVICSEVLEHLSDVRPAIGELVRMLAPGGQLIVSVPRSWPEALCWLLSSEYRNMPGGHRHIIKTTHLKTAIQTHGLRHWRTHWAHSLHAPYWWLKCLVGVNRDTFPLVRRYHQFLVWDMMRRPRLTQLLEGWLNPLLGKSVVLYFTKDVD